jgi:putative tryptophan/tyrosine transport system substrate-binding protein
VLKRWLMFCLAACWIAPLVLAQKASVAVVSIAGIQAYTETIEGIREQIPDLQVWDARDERQLRERLNAQQPALAIAVGSDAALMLERVAAPQLPVVKSVLLEWDLERPSGEHSASATITVEMDPSALLAELRRLFPDKTRIGVIRGPTQTAGYMKSIEQAARQLGFTLEIRNCAEARELVKIFLEFQAMDFVWCPPNPQLYNSATLKPLLIASITRQLPIIGFSLQFVGAGALFGGAPDFREVGRQTADIALRILRHQPVPAKLEACKFRFAYNQRVARLVGVKAAVSDQQAVRLDILP